MSGTWEVAEQIFAIWRGSYLDGIFRAEATVNTPNYPVLHDQKARPSPPGPYCVYEQAAGVPIGRMTGNTANTELMLQRLPLQFRIHGSTEEQVVHLAYKVKLVFDGARVEMESLELVCISTEDDFGAREGDNEWVWVVPYLLTIDEQTPLRAG